MENYMVVFFVGFFPQRTPHIGEAGGQRNSSEGKRREEKGNDRIRLYMAMYYDLST